MAVAAAAARRYTGSMAMALWIAAGGALGSVAHHVVNVVSARMLGIEFPWGTSRSMSWARSSWVP
jgi:hypothetical protein